MLPINEYAAKEFLKGQRWPSGMQQAALNSMQKMPIRYFIVDDSGSMASADGNRMFYNGDKAV